MSWLAIKGRESWAWRCGRAVWFEARRIRCWKKKSCVCVCVYVWCVCRWWSWMGSSTSSSGTCYSSLILLLTIAWDLCLSSSGFFKHHINIPRLSRRPYTLGSCYDLSYYLLSIDMGKFHECTQPGKEVSITRNEILIARGQQGNLYMTCIIDGNNNTMSEATPSSIQEIARTDTVYGYLCYTAAVHYCCYKEQAAIISWSLALFSVQPLPSSIQRMRMIAHNSEEHSARFEERL